MKFMKTYSGYKFFPEINFITNISLIDIAHSLSNQCRYGGHAPEFYSVAEHSILMTEWALSNGMSSNVTKWCLMHDASEAYVTDVPTPVKDLCGDFKIVENKVQDQIARRFRLDSMNVPEEVHAIDKRILLTEMQRFDGIQRENSLDVELQFWSPKEAKQEFLALAKFLGIS